MNSKKKKKTAFKKPDAWLVASLSLSSKLYRAKLLYRPLVWHFNVPEIGICLGDTIICLWLI